MIYQWADRSRQPGSAQVVGERLEQIRIANDGKLVTRDVVVDARSPDSPLHRYFEWKDHVAALKYREQQARSLIHQVVVVFDEMPDKEVRAFVCVGEPEHEEYAPYQAIGVALREPDTRDVLLARALRELESWTRRYHHLSELAAVIRSIEESRPAVGAAA